MTGRDYENDSLAVELVNRLNAMIEAEPAVDVALGLLLSARVQLPDEALRDHPTIQVGSIKDGPVDSGPIEVGFMGMLNGIVGVLPEGKRAGWGYIAAVVEKDGHVSRFSLVRDLP